MAIQVNLDLMLVRRGMTLSELSERVGVTLSNLSILKTNKARAVRFTTLNAICRELECQPGDLLEYTSSAKPASPAESRESIMIRVITDGVLAASLLFGLPMSGAAAQEPDSTPAFTGIEGRWEGLLGGRLRLVVDIIRTQDGLFFGTLTSVDQGGTEVPIGRIDVDGDAVRFPPALRHRLTFGDQALEGMVPVVEETTAVLGPPLRGGPWYAANGPSNSAGHRRALVPLEGEAFIAQRYAIDWAKVGDNGQAFEGDGSDNEAYFGYGEAVLAVSDALVEAVRDGIAENAVLHVTLGRSTLYDMKTAAVTIRLDPSLEEMLDRVCRDTGRSRSEVVREALRRQLTLELFEEARRQLIPFAEAQGIYTDEDVFKLVS